MISSRDLVAASLTAVVLAARLVLSWQWHAILVAVVAAVLAIGWTWSRHERERLLRRRLAVTATAGFASAFAVAIAAAYVGAATLVLGATVILAAAGVRERLRLRGAALSERSEERAAFEGTVGAIGEPTQEPAVWVAQERRRWWSSAERIELRGDGKRVVIDPSAARATGESSPYGSAKLDGADSSRVRWWQFAPGESAFVIGNVTAEADPSTATFRDPPRVPVFAGELVLGKGRLADARRHASMRVLVWGGLAVGAAALVGAQLLGYIG